MFEPYGRRCHRNDADEALQLILPGALKFFPICSQRCRTDAQRRKILNFIQLKVHSEAIAMRIWRGAERATATGHTATFVYHCELCSIRQKTHLKSLRVRKVFHSGCDCPSRRIGTLRRGESKSFVFRAAPHDGWMEIGSAKWQSLVAFGHFVVRFVKLSENKHELITNLQSTVQLKSKKFVFVSGFERFRLDGSR